MITAIAIDDEPSALKVIKNHATKIKDLNILQYFYNAKEAILFLQQNPVDLIFLDINMPHISGMELLEKTHTKAFIIFTTAYAQFAADSYHYNTIDYLLKPFEFDRFQMAIEKVRTRLDVAQKQNTFFFIKDGFRTIKIEFDNILFVKGSGNYLDIISKQKTYSPRMTFTAFISKVPAMDFIRVHQSYLVNINNIQKIENNHIFIGEHRIPISSRYKELFLNRLGV